MHTFIIQHVSCAFKPSYVRIPIWPNLATFILFGSLHFYAAFGQLRKEDPNANLDKQKMDIIILLPINTCCGAYGYYDASKTLICIRLPGFTLQLEAAELFTMSIRKHLCAWGTKAPMDSIISRG